MDDDEEEECVLKKNAISVAFKKLPKVLEKKFKDDSKYCTLCLFYQYVDPLWDAKEHKEAVKFVTELANKYEVKGRGRCAKEGLNCTLTGPAKGIRKFCKGLRKWNKAFEGTDFKLTDGLSVESKFKRLTIRKVDELVAYGLASQDVTPSLSSFSGSHLEAVEYHEFLKQKDTVVIDVRNAYESAIGHFDPPKGGAELIDPKMRNSRDFAPWLNLPDTKEKLNGKKVMMYCTGGIRCEKATALLNEMTKASEGTFQTQGVYELRGGVER